MSRVRTFAEAYKSFRGDCGACSDAASVGIAGLDDFARRRVLRVHGCKNFPGVARISKAGDGNIRIVGIGEIGSAIRENATHHFSNHVNAFDVVPALKRNALQHVQCFDDGDTTGAGRRRSEDFPGMAIAIVFRAQNLADFRLVLGEIVEGNETAEPRHILYKRAGSFAAIKLRGAVPGDAFERGGQFWLTNGIPGLKHFAVIQKDAPADGKALQTRALLFEFMREPLADRKAIFRKANGRSHDVRELHRAIGFQRESEACDCSGDSDRLVADDGSFFIELAVFSDVHVAPGLIWRYLAVIEEGGLAVGKANQHETAAADVARSRFDDSKRESHGHRGIYRVASALEDFDSCLRGEFFVGRDHAMAGANSLGRPTLGVVGTVTEFGTSLAANRRRRQANEENTHAE